MSARILAIGGAHLDRRGRLDGSAVPGASNPGRWREEAGGGVFNAAATLSRLGHSVRLVAPRGGDAAGAIVAEAARAAGIEDTPLTFLDRATPSYTAILGPGGDLLIALADMALYDIYGPRQMARRTIRDAIAAADAVLTDANLPAATLKALCDACAAARRPLFAIAISPAKVGRLAPVLGRLAGLFMNAAEARVLADGEAALPGALIARGLASGIVSRGGEAVLAFKGSAAWEITPPCVEPIVDVTGAGDALAAGFIDGRLRGLPLPEALRCGVAAASIALRSERAAPDIDRLALEAALTAVRPPVAGPAFAAPPAAVKAATGIEDRTPRP